MDSIIKVLHGNPVFIDCRHGSGALRHISWVRGRTFRIAAFYQADEIETLVKASVAADFFRPWIAEFTCESSSATVVFYKETHRAALGLLPPKQQITISINPATQRLQIVWDDTNTWVQTSEEHDAVVKQAQRRIANAVASMNIDKHKRRFL